MKRSSTGLIAVLVVLAAGLAPFSAAGSDKGVQIATRSKTLVVGRASDDSVKAVENLGPMAEYLTKQLSHLGYPAGEPVVARTNEEMVDLIRKGEVDIISGFPYRRAAMRQAGLEAVQVRPGQKPPTGLVAEDLDQLRSLYPLVKDAM